MDCPSSDAIAQGSGAGYWAESSRPISSLVFMTPLLLVYELGVLALGPESVRNGADVWLRELLRMLGLGQYFLLPALTVGILVGWHHATRQPWRITTGLLPGMFAECVLLALVLRCFLQVQAAVFQMAVGPLAPPDLMAIDSRGAVHHAVAYLGAGVYEELLFRLMLLPAVACVLKQWGMKRRPSVLVAVVSTSFVFAAAHYVGCSGSAVQCASAGFWFGATFRFLAGVFFSVLFVYRGFGIAAGTHAGYDILVGSF